MAGTEDLEGLATFETAAQKAEFWAREAEQFYEYQVEEQGEDDFACAHATCALASAWAAIAQAHAIRDRNMR